MSWNQQFNGNSYGGRQNGFGGYTRAPFNPQYQNAPQRFYTGQNRALQTKKSGCKIKEGKNGKPAITAWKKTRSAFLTLVACPNNAAHIGAKDGHAMLNKKNQEYARWTATIVDRNTGSITTHSALYNLVTGKLYLTDLKMVCSPMAPNGGFWGNSFVSKRR